MVHLLANGFLALAASIGHWTLDILRRVNRNRDNSDEAIAFGELVC